MYYTTSGSVRGSCGHRHRTVAAATKCMRRDHEGCVSQGGYSDRIILFVHVDGQSRTLTRYEASEGERE